MSKIIIRTIEAKGITVYADETGCVYVNDRSAGRVIDHNGLVYVWAGEQDGLPPHAKIAFTSEHVALINAHSAAWRAEMEKRARNERAYDLANNEGGEGYNPYRRG